MKALIDGDIVIYRAAWASQNDPEAIAVHRANYMLEIMLSDTKADEYEVWVSDDASNNFRYAVDPSYKANRIAPKPLHYQAVKDFLLGDWRANIALGMEADDALGISQCAELSDEGLEPYHYTSIICSIDKDLMQIPGLHYDFVKKESRDVSPIEGTRQLYLQMLIGDQSDNVRGVDKIGKVKANKLLGHLEDEYDMFTVVRGLYNDDERLLRNGRLLYIRRKDNEVWCFPSKKETISRGEEPPLEFTQRLEGGNVPFTGHTLIENPLGSLPPGEQTDVCMPPKTETLT